MQLFCNFDNSVRSNYFLNRVFENPSQVFVYFFLNRSTLGFIYHDYDEFDDISHGYLPMDYTSLQPKHKRGIEQTTFHNCNSASGT